MLRIPENWKLIGSHEMPDVSRAAHIKTSLFTKGYVENRIQERWLQWFLKSMEGGTVSQNSDFRPSGVFYDLSYWNALFSPYLTAIFYSNRLKRHGLKLTFALMGLLTALGVVVLREPPGAPVIVRLMPC